MEQPLSDFIEDRLTSSRMQSNIIRLQQFLEVHGHLPSRYGIMRPTCFGDYKYQDAKIPLIHYCEFYYTTGVHDGLTMSMWYAEEYREAYKKVMRHELPIWVHGDTTLGALLPYLNQSVESLKPAESVEPYEQELEKHSRETNLAIPMQVIAERWQKRMEPVKLARLRNNDELPPVFVWSLEAISQDVLIKEPEGEQV